jgi:transposase-like protein
VDREAAGIVTESASGRNEAAGQAERMDRTPDLYCCHRFLGEIISHAVWLYHSFSLSFRDVELLLAKAFRI